MTEKEANIRRHIRHLLRTEQLAVLATQRLGQPYASLMAFASSPDLKTILVATGRATRKYRNLRQEPRVSLLFDNRANNEADFHAASALTAVGRAETASAEESPELQALYLERHPYLEQFLAAPTTILLKIRISHYLLVTRFQTVFELHLDDELDLFGTQR